MVWGQCYYFKNIYTEKMAICLKLQLFKQKNGKICFVRRRNCFHKIDENRRKMFIHNIWPLAAVFFKKKHIRYMGKVKMF
jgi:hypothetical protein